MELEAKIQMQLAVLILVVLSLLVARWLLLRRRRRLARAKQEVLSTTDQAKIIPKSVVKESREPVMASTPQGPETRIGEAGPDSVGVEVESERTQSSHRLKAPMAPPAEAPVEPQRRSLAEALAPTKRGLLGRIRDLIMGHGGLKNEELEELEEILYTSDLGPRTVQHLMAALEERLSGKERSDFTAVRDALRTEMKAIFAEMESAAALANFADLVTADEDLTVIMVVGVNGAGKTTTIGKLASQFARAHKKVLIAAGDTFRAAADRQLRVWTERAGVEIFSPENVKDPSAVAFDACQMAKARGFQVLIVDTAGRLHTQKNLMEELKKMKRVMGKVVPTAPHQVLLVLDANSGQNALIQAKEFHDSLGVTGVILTKLDGSAKGGVAVGLVHELGLPIKLIGVGEGLEDLRPFSAGEFVDSII